MSFGSVSSVRLFVIVVLIRTAIAIETWGEKWRYWKLCLVMIISSFLWCIWGSWWCLHCDGASSLLAHTSLESLKEVVCCFRLGYVKKVLEMSTNRAITTVVRKDLEPNSVMRNLRANLHANNIFYVFRFWANITDEASAMLRCSILFLSLSIYLFLFACIIDSLFTFFFRWSSGQNRENNHTLFV